MKYSKIVPPFLKNVSNDKEITWSSASSFLKKSRYLIFLSMLYMSIMIANAILTNRYVSLDKNTIILGESLISPLIFILADIVAEIFGCRLARQLIYCGFICEMLLALICWLIVHMPYPAFFENNFAYLFILGHLYYIVLSSFFAFIVASLVNVYIITRWKQLLKSKYFWLRSLGASTIAEALFTVIGIFMIQLGSIPLVNIWKTILFSYLIKVVYSIIFSGPGSFIVYYIKASMHLNEQEHSLNYNPFEVNKDLT